MILTPAGRLQRVAESGVERSNLILGRTPLPSAYVQAPTSPVPYAEGQLGLR